MKAGIGRVYFMKIETCVQGKKSKVEKKYEWLLTATSQHWNSIQILKQKRYRTEKKWGTNSQASQICQQWSKSAGMANYNRQKEMGDKNMVFQQAEVLYL